MVGLVDIATVAKRSGLCLLLAECCVLIVHHLDLISIDPSENKITTLFVLLEYSETVLQQLWSEWCGAVV